jgi:hypothetical protein
MTSRVTTSAPIPGVLNISFPGSNAAHAIYQIEVKETSIIDGQPVTHCGTIVADQSNSYRQVRRGSFSRTMATETSRATEITSAPRGLLCLWPERHGHAPTNQDNGQNKDAGGDQGSTPRAAKAQRVGDDRHRGEGHGRGGEDGADFAEDSEWD